MSPPDLPLAARDLATGGNDLLAAMAEADLADVARIGRRVSCARDTILVGAGQLADAAYFIERGAASVIPAGETRAITDILMIGPEGVAGAAPVLGAIRSPYATVVQGDDLRAVQVDAAALRTLADRNERFRAVLATAAYRQMLQMADNLVSAAWQPIVARLARWLAMYSTRMRSQRLYVTHAFLAMRIGAQRTRVTAALHELEGCGVIASLRGCVVIRDAAKLQRMAARGYPGEADAIRAG